MFWLGQTEFEPIANAMPKRSKDKPEDYSRSLARATTDASGRFELAAEFDLKQFTGRSLVVNAKGIGISGRLFTGDTLKEAGDGDNEPLKFPLRKPVTIEGRLLVRPERLRKASRSHWGCYPATSLKPTRSTAAALARTTNSAPNTGRNPGQPTTMADSGSKASCPKTSSRSSVFAIPTSPMTNSSFRQAGRWPTGCATRNMKPFAARFTHILEPARPLTGVVTDKETGKPLAGVVVEVMPQREMRGSGGITNVTAMTDASGRYRVAGPAGDTYHVTAFPEPDSGYLALLTQDNRWPLGAKALSVDIALPKGRIVRGVVLEGIPGKPVVGASVVYQPGPNNSLDRGDCDFENPVLTDKNGRFARSPHYPAEAFSAWRGRTPNLSASPSPDPRCPVRQWLGPMDLPGSICRKKKARRSPIHASRCAKG